MSDGVLGRVLRWLRAGYPDGVPQQDYVALLGLLHRQLTPTEMNDIVAALGELADESNEPIGREDIQRMVAEKVFQQATDEEISRVAARLALGGWPLASADEFVASRGGAEDEIASDGKDGLISRIVTWLHKGYPTGVPKQDYVPVLALLQRRLTDEEIELVADRLSADGTMPDRAEIGVAITKIKNAMPSAEDFERVHAHLDESELDGPP